MHTNLSFPESYRVRCGGNSVCYNRSANLYLPSWLLCLALYWSSVLQQIFQFTFFPVCFPVLSQLHPALCHCTGVEGLTAALLISQERISEQIMPQAEIHLCCTCCFCRAYCKACMESCKCNAVVWACVSILIYQKKNEMEENFNTIEMVSVL